MKMKSVKQLFCLIKEIFSKFSIPVVYEIVEVDISQSKATLRLVGKSVLTQYDFSQLVGDSTILSGLSAEQACLLGGCYGRAMRVSFEKGGALKKVKNMSFLLKNTQGKYRIVFQNRTGEIGYFDKKTKQEFIEQPLTVASNEHIISKFDPSQACYIGILAGISMEKTLSRDKKTGQNQLEALLRKSPKLRIVE